MQLRLRTRIILGSMIPLVLVGVISTVAGAHLIARSVSGQVQHSLESSINTARLIYQGDLDDLHEAVRLASFDPAIRAALTAGAPDQGLPRLAELQQLNRVDVLDLLDPDGRVLLRAQAPARSGDSLAGRHLVQRVIAGRGDLAATGVATGAELEIEDPVLAERASITAQPAVSGGQAEEVTGGLLLEAAAVVRDGDRPIGILYGARLLNRDVRMVDAIYETVFKGETYHGSPIGEATIFLGDVRVATVIANHGDRAVGTRLDPEVRANVITHGRPWVGRAEVVGDRHITSYEPIRDLSGKVVGALALGILERRFTEPRRDALAVFLAITLAGVVLSFLVAVTMTRRIVSRVRRLVDAVERVAGGDFGHRVGVDSDIYEMALLEGQIDRMSVALAERDATIKRQTEERISRSERLAIVGRLAAGVAHQINNPLGGILLFSNLLLRKFPEEGIERENLERISNEAKRCQSIVQGLLDFARHREPTFERARIEEVVERALRLVEHQGLFLNVAVTRRYAEDAPSADVDVTQMQEVFLNLVLNAVQAMNERGELTVTVAPEPRENAVRITIADTGPGIAEDQVEKIFEPFFTTKDVGRGTGLGLSVSRGIVEGHGGIIWAESRPGAGANFVIRLPVAQAPDAAVAP